MSDLKFGWFLAQGSRVSKSMFKQTHCNHRADLLTPTEFLPPNGAEIYADIMCAMWALNTFHCLLLGLSHYSLCSVMVTGFTCAKNVG